MSSIIEVKGLSKNYTISHESEKYTTLRDVMARKAKKLFSFPKSLAPKRNVIKEEFWALKDISFDIQQGDRVGIIGRNGAGKSTLLKILSRITEPTTGTVKIKGRVASLLEVGTGFHPELTGRENIFLNGAILGMSRVEIKKHFDAIVDFAETERFLDTPVKRYSSGMYVRLAFAIAAHLEPEILVIDEVLAVGDAQFQKKCLGKMEDVSINEGRTVLFVSHNMNTIQSICTAGILLSKGEIELIGDVRHCIKKYLSSGLGAENSKIIRHDIDPLKDSQILEASLIDNNSNIIIGSLSGKNQLYVLIKYKVNKKIYRWHLTYYMRNENGEIIFFSDRTDYHHGYMEAAPGIYTFKLKIPVHLLLPGKYFLTTYCGNEDSGNHFVSQDTLSFEVENIDDFRTGYRDGHFYQAINWEQLNYEVNA